MKMPRNAHRSLLVAGLVALAVPFGAVGAHAAGPVTVAWWSRTSPAPPPPDVQRGNLLVEGVLGDPSEEVPDTADAPLPVPSPPSVSLPEGSGRGGATAIIGLSFRVPDGQRADELVLSVEGPLPPPTTTVRACAATEPFRAAWNGSFDDVPAFDCSTSIAGQIREDGALVFGAVDRLARDGVLSVVILPGRADRLVIAEPGPDALVTGEAGYGAGDIPAGLGGATGGFTPSTRGTAAGPALSGGGTPGMSSGSGEPLLADGGAAGGVAGGKPDLPVVAPGGQRAQAGLPLPPLHGLPATIALGCALGMVVAGFLLPLLRRALPIAVVIGAASEAPVVVGGPGGRQRGVGRFTAERSGSPPPL